MTIRAFTTLLAGPGAVEWSTRLLAKVKRTFEYSKATPAKYDTKNSGAFGSSTNFGALGGNNAGAVMIQGTPSGGVWQSLDGGETWKNVSE